MKRRFRFIVGVTLVIITLVAFVYYISGHTYLLKELAHIPPSTIVWLILLYAGWFAILVLILYITMLICKKTLSTKENILLNAYSTLVNFFIPGQGGIAVRGVYLKKVKDLAIRNFIYASLLYFMFYAVICIILLLITNQQWWKTLVATIVIGGISLSVIYFYKSKSKIKPGSLDLSKKNLFYLFLATLLQSIIQITIYGVELHTVNPNIALHQFVTYTGAANFALFVALTPGAIGIRESFLLLSRHLSGISSANIISASIIDRAVFIVFLGLIFALTVFLHAKYKNFIKSSDPEKDI